MSLRADDKLMYREQGFLVIEDVIGPDTLREMRTAISCLLNESRSVRASNEIYDIAPGHSPEHPRVRRIKDPHLQHPAFDAVMRGPEIVDVVAELLGGTVRFDHAKLNFKPPGGDASIEWHQDWAFYPHTNDDLLAVGVMIEDCTSENGPLMVVPGTHRGQIYNHHYQGAFVGAIDPAHIADLILCAVPLTMSAGSISIHHVRTVHGSGDNVSGSIRPLLLFGYAAVDAFPVFAKPDLADYDARILRGEAMLEARQVAVPVRIPEPRNPGADSIFDNQAIVARRSFR